MKHSAESRVVLAIATTALVMGMIWIFTEISAVSVPTQSPSWRYTRYGWTDVSDLTVPAASSYQGPVDQVSPWVIAGLQLLAGLIILIGFADHRRRQQRGPADSQRESDIGTPHRVERRRHQRSAAAAGTGN